LNRILQLSLPLHSTPASLNAGFMRVANSMPLGQQLTLAVPTINCFEMLKAKNEDNDGQSWHGAHSWTMDSATNHRPFPCFGVKGMVLVLGQDFVLAGAIGLLTSSQHACDPTPCLSGVHSLTVVNMNSVQTLQEV
jgi:hypothetical protein